MTLISHLVHWTRWAIGYWFFVVSIFTMRHGSVSSFFPSREFFVAHNGMTSVMIIIIWFKELWVIRGLGQLNNKFYRGKINWIWKRIRGITGSFVRAGAFIDGNGREIQIWCNRINWKEIIEAVVNCPIVVLYHRNCLVLAFLWNYMTE